MNFIKMFFEFRRFVMKYNMKPEDFEITIKAKDEQNYYEFLSCLRLEQPDCVRPENNKLIDKIGGIKVRITKPVRRGNKAKQSWLSEQEFKRQYQQVLMFRTDIYGDGA